MSFIISLICVLVVEFQLTLYELGGNKQELLIAAITRVLPVFGPLPLSPVTFTSKLKCHICMPGTLQQRGIVLMALIPAICIDPLFRHHSSSHHG